MSQIDENTLALFDDTTGFITVDQDQRYYLDETTGTEITEFSVDFNDDLPGTIIMRKWSQKVNGLDITIANKNITFIEGSPGFGNDLDSTLLDNPVGFNNYDIRNCNWIATNGLVNGFGQAGRVGGVGVSITCTGILTECNYVGIGAGTLWFVNLEDMPQVEFSNNTLTQAVLNSTRYGTPIYGIEFDGTLRSQQGQYTFRRNAIGLADVWNSHIGSISSGTAYRTTDGNADAQEAFLQYHGTTDKTEYSINTRVESTEIQNLGDTTFATITDSGTTLDVSNSDGNTITDTTINANRLLDFNDVVNSIITLTGNATGAPDSSLILDDALETMRLTTTGTISGLTNTQGFFDAATGATKNVEISGTDIDSSIDANAVLINFDNITNSANDFGRIRVVGTGIFNAAATHTTLQFGNDTSNPPPPDATIKNLRVSDSSLTFAEKIGEWIDLYNNDADTQGTASLSGTSNILITLPVGASNILTDGGGIFGYTGTLEFTAIDPLTTVSALVNTTVTSTGRIGSNMPFGDITHSTLNATTSITLGGNLIRNNALAALTTSLTSPIINIDYS